MSKDKEYLRSLAVDGVIPIDVYISAMFKILNAPGAKHIYHDNPLDDEQPTK